MKAGAVAAAARCASHTAAADGGRGNALTPTACTPPQARRGTSEASIQPTAAACPSPRRDSPSREPRLLSHAHTCGPLGGAVDETKPNGWRPGAAGARRPQALDGPDQPHSHPPRPCRQARCAAVRGHAHTRCSTLRVTLRPPTRTPWLPLAADKRRGDAHKLGRSEAVLALQTKQNVAAGVARTQAADTSKQSKTQDPEHRRARVAGGGSAATTATRPCRSRCHGERMGSTAKWGDEHKRTPVKKQTQETVRAWIPTTKMSVARATAEMRYTRECAPTTHSTKQKDRHAQHPHTNPTSSHHKKRTPSLDTHARSVHPPRRHMSS